MESSDAISGIAAIISCLAFWLAYKATKINLKIRESDKVQELRISVSDMLSEINIIKMRFESLHINQTSSVVLKTNEFIDSQLKKTEGIHLLMFEDPVGLNEKIINDFLIEAKTLNDELSRLKHQIERIKLMSNEQG